MVRGDKMLTQALAQLVGHLLGQLFCVDEHQRGSVLRNVCGYLVDDLVELIARDRRFELAIRQLERDLTVAQVAAVDDRREWFARTHEQVRRHLDRPDRRGQPNPNRPPVGDSPETLRVRVRWEPRSSRARAWISSTITVSTLTRVARERSAVR